MENAATQAAALEGVVSALIVDTETGIIVHQEGVEDGLYPGLISAVYAELLRQPSRSENTQVTPSPASDLNDIVLRFDSHHHVIRPLRSASAPARHVFCVVANHAAIEVDALLCALVEIERQIDSAPPEVSRQSSSHYRKEQELSSLPPTDGALETTGDSHPLLPLLFGSDVLKLLDSGTP